MKYSAPEGFFGYENQVTFHINIDSKLYFYLILKCHFGFFSYQIKMKWHFTFKFIEKELFAFKCQTEIIIFFKKKKSLLNKFSFSRSLEAFVAYINWKNIVLDFYFKIYVKKYCFAQAPLFAVIAIWGPKNKNIIATISFNFQSPNNQAYSFSPALHFTKTPNLLPHYQPAPPFISR